jgi:hypothetical protein
MKNENEKNTVKEETIIDKDNILGEGKFCSDLEWCKAYPGIPYCPICGKPNPYYERAEH